MSVDTAAIAPFPGVPTTWDLAGHTLTLYYEADPATGVIPTVEIGSTSAWTMPALRATLADYGVAPVSRQHRAGDALVTAMAGIVAIGERMAAAAAHSGRALSASLTAHTAPHGPRA